MADTAVLLDRAHEPGCAQHLPEAPTHRPAGTPAFAGAVLLRGDETHAQWLARQLTNLIRVGGKLAVLGVEDNARAMGWWHVARPGTWTMPQGLTQQGNAEGGDLTYATALCRRTIVTNGYAADWRPPPGVLCPGCAEQL